MPESGALDPDPILDAHQIDALRELTAGGENMLMVMAELFVGDTPPRLEALRSAAAAGDAESLARGAHALVGSAGNVGAARMVSMCRALDHAARAGDVAHAPAMVARLLTEYELVEAALRANLPPAGR